MKKNILITGGAGFVGSNLAVYLKTKWSDCRVLCFDNLIRKGSALNRERLKDFGISFIKGDIRDLNELLKLKDIDILVECSAEPSVLAAYENPDYTIDTNLIGTLNCLKLAKREKSDFIFLSTSRVYPIAKVESIPHVELSTRFDWTKDTKGAGFSYQGITHEFPLAGVRSLYGASKLSSELLALEYFHMFGLKGIINRFGIIAGPWQMGKIDQGLVGFWVAQHKYGKGLNYIGYSGEGKQVRDALHVDDACALIFEQIQNIKKVKNETFNIGGGRRNSFSLLELTKMTRKITGKKIPVGRKKKTRKDDIRIYIADNAYVTKKTGWVPEKNLEDILSDVDGWIDGHYNSLKNILT